MSQKAQENPPTPKKSSIPPSKLENPAKTCLYSHYTRWTKTKITNERNSLICTQRKHHYHRSLYFFRVTLSKRGKGELPSTLSYVSFPLEFLPSKENLANLKRKDPPNTNNSQYKLPKYSSLRAMHKKMV